jgi:hypothetical protein
MDILGTTDAREAAIIVSSVEPDVERGPGAMLGPGQHQRSWILESLTAAAHRAAGAQQRVAFHIGIDGDWDSSGCLPSSSNRLDMSAAPSQTNSKNLNSLFRAQCSALAPFQRRRGAGGGLRLRETAQDTCASALWLDTGVIIRSAEPQYLGRSTTRSRLTGS